MEHKTTPPASPAEKTQTFAVGDVVALNSTDTPATVFEVQDDGGLRIVWLDDNREANELNVPPGCVKRVRPQETNVAWAVPPMAPRAVAG